MGRMYEYEILPLAIGAFLIGVACIVFRKKTAKGSNAMYDAIGARRLVFKESSLNAGMVVAGCFLMLLSIGIAISGFFLG